MALHNAQTPSNRASLILSIKDEQARQVAFSTGNSFLASEVAHLATDAKRIKLLDAETAEEAVSWISDPEVLEQIVSSDPRRGVAEAARRRARAVSAEITSVPNQRNIEERTKRILSQPTAEVIKSLSTVDELHYSFVETYLAEASDEDFATVIAGLLGTRRNLIYDQHAVRVRVKSLLANGGDRAYSALAAAVIENRDMARSLIGAWEHPWTSFTASMALRVTDRVDHLEILRKHTATPVILPECLDVWRQAQRPDILSFSGLVEPEELIEFIGENPGFLAVATLIDAASRADYVDVLTEKMVELGALVTEDSRNSWRTYLPRAVSVPGIQRQTVVHLCALVDPTILATLLNEENTSFKPCPERQLDEAMVAEIASFMSYTRASETMTRNSYSSREENTAPLMLTFADAVCANTRGSAQLLQRRYSTSSWVSEFLAERAVSKLGYSTSAWSSFWTLYGSTPDATFDEILEAATLLA